MIYNPYLIKKEKFYKKKYNKNKTFNIISTGRLVKQKNFVIGNLCYLYPVTPLLTITTLKKSYQMAEVHREE